MSVSTDQLEAIVRREHPDPHSVLGAHAAAGGVTIRAHRPAARAITAFLNGDDDTIELEQIHPGGVFEGTVEGAELPVSYRLSGWRYR